MSAIRRSSLGAMLWVVFGCSYEHGRIPADVGVSPPDVEIDVATVPRAYWVAASVSRGANPFLVVHRFVDGEATACPEHAVPRVNKFLLSHPTLPAAFAADSGFAAIAMGCAGATYLGNTTLGAQRTVQRIVYEPSTAVGFFTIDGPQALGVYRFTTAADATPTIASSANATAQAGALALDASRSMLITAGTNVTASYSLTGNAFDLPATYMTATGCAQPMDLIVSGPYTLLFCADSPDVLRYTTSPFAFDSRVGAIGMVDRVIPLPGDRAIAARTTPDLAILTLGGGAPTWSSGPTLGSRITAMTASVDGEILATARQLDGTTAELALWRIADQSVTPITTLPVTGVIAALAITTATE